MKKVKVAVVGAGLIGEIHAEVYTQYEKSELVWVCDLDMERAKKIADRFNCKFTTDAHVIADDKEIQGVSIVTPDFAHKEVSLQMEPCILSN